MRKLIVALAFGCSFALAGPVHAEFYAGGPIQQGNMCQKNTDGSGYYGYMVPCENQTVAVKNKKMKRS
jgi:hypothetical protein